MRFGHAAAALLLAGAAAAPAGAASQPAPDTAAPTLRYLGPDGEPLPFRSDGEVLDFLSTADVVDSARVKGGISGARKLLLEQDGVRACAVFRVQAVAKMRADLEGGGFAPHFRDHHANEVAAYRLARALGLDTIPPTVARELWDQEGSLQLWIEGGQTAKDLRPSELRGVALLKHRMQVDLMNVFDALIHNIDRNAGNYLTAPSGETWWVDHTRSFSRVPWLPRDCRVERVDKAFWKRLETMPDGSIARALSPHLDQPEIEGVLERRRLLVEMLSKRLAEKGPGAVLFDVSYARASAR